jgi:LemA protein
MSKKSTTALVVIIVMGLILLYPILIYNGMVKKDVAVEAAWSQVENQYQRRADLIDNLVKTVKGYSIHEAETLQAVTEARAKASQTQVNLDDSSPFTQFQASQDSLSSALSRLMVVVEQYPNLKADQSFLELQSQLEGTENRIAFERKNYNETVMEYNIMIRQFPKNIIAEMFEFEKAELFESESGAEVVPEVNF